MTLARMVTLPVEVSTCAKFVGSVAEGDSGSNSTKMGDDGPYCEGEDMEGREKKVRRLCFVLLHVQSEKKEKKEEKKTRNCIFEQLIKESSTHLVAAFGTSTFPDLTTFGKMDNDLECQWLDIGTGFARGIDGFTSVDTHRRELVGRRGGCG